MNYIALNFTTLSECGFATAVDSLLAVKELVYDTKTVSLAELGRILDADWEGIFGEGPLIRCCF